jgi:hypothetical protein
VSFEESAGIPLLVGLEFLASADISKFVGATASGDIGFTYAHGVLNETPLLLNWNVCAHNSRRNLLFNIHSSAFHLSADWTGSTGYKTGFCSHRLLWFVY